MLMVSLESIQTLFLFLKLLEIKKRFKTRRSRQKWCGDLQSNEKEGEPGISN